MSRDADCVFCKIVAGEIPSTAVYQDDAIYSFLDIGPLAEGHLLVIPRDHYVNLMDMPPELCGRLASMIPTLGKAVLKVTSASGFNLLCNQGSVAGQVVPHVHFHFIPRNEGDGLGYRWNAGTYPNGKLDQLIEAYRAALASR